jgi:hypothetical protein
LPGAFAASDHGLHFGAKHEQFSPAGTAFVAGFAAGFTADWTAKSDSNRHEMWHCLKISWMRPFSFVPECEPFMEFPAMLPE